MTALQEGHQTTGEVFPRNLNSTALQVGGVTFVLGKEAAQGGLSHILGVENDSGNNYLFKVTQSPIDWDKLDRTIGSILNPIGNYNNLSYYSIDLNSISRHDGNGGIPFSALTVTDPSEDINGDYNFRQLKEFFILGVLQELPNIPNAHSHAVVIKDDKNAYIGGFIRRIDRAETLNIKGIADIPDGEGKRSAYLKLIESLRTAAHGLDEAHRLGVIHRDVKPDNIIQNDEYTTSLIDFGLALLDNNTLRKQNGIKGSLAYMAPELVSDNPEYSDLSDNYSFVLMCLEALVSSSEDRERAERLVAKFTPSQAKLIQRYMINDATPIISDDFELELTKILGIPLDRAIAVGQLFRIGLDKEPRFRIKSNLVFVDMLHNLINGRRLALSALNYATAMRTTSNEDIINDNEETFVNLLHLTFNQDISKFRTDLIERITYALNVSREDFENYLSNSDFYPYWLRPIS